MLRNKKILFFCSDFFGLYKDIEKKLIEMGNSVFYYDERPSNSFIAKLMIRKNVKFYNRIVDRYYSDIADKYRNEGIDYVFIVKGESVTTVSLKNLRALFPKSKFILYLWDSLDNIPGIFEKLSCFDSVFSFDLEDAKKYSKITFRPLYYSDKFNKVDCKCEYDIAFIGTAHSIRPYVVNQLKRQCDNYGFSFFSYLYSPHPLVFLYNKIVNKAYKNLSLKDINFKPISQEQIQSIYARTRAILDVEVHTQTGLTMRTLEVLGMHKKLITTNISCKNYDFYRPENHLIISKKCPELPIDFLKHEYQELPTDIYKKYTIEYFLKEVFSEE